MIILNCDPTGVPLISLNSGFDMQLLPLLKWQFEAFCTATPDFPTAARAEMLDLNPALDLNQCNDKNREQLFQTGLLPAEALQFARWMGDRYDLPTLQEWRLMYDDLLLESASVGNLHKLPAQAESDVAREVLQRLIAQIQPYALLDLALLNGGVVEWVYADDRRENFVGVGAPRPGFHPNLYDPLTNVVTPLNAKERIKYFGARLIRRTRPLSNTDRFLLPL